MAKVDQSVYCIANNYALNLFDLNLHQSDIQDSANNTTRFLVIGKMIEDKGLNNKTSVMINLNDRIGSLLEILQPFNKLGINMTRIKTRPSRNNEYQHTFFIDFEDFYEDKNITELLNILESMTKGIRVIGSYDVIS